MSKIGDFFRALAKNEYEEIDDPALQDFLAENSDSEKRIKDFEHRLQVEVPAKKVAPTKSVVKHVDAATKPVTSTAKEISDRGER